MAILYLIIILFGVTFDICLYGVLVYTKSLLYFCIFVQRVYFLQQVNYFVISGYWKTPVLSPCILRALCTAAFSIKRERAARCKIINCCTPEKFCANCKKYNYKLFITSSIAKRGAYPYYIGYAPLEIKLLQPLWSLPQPVLALLYCHFPFQGQV